MPRLYRSVGVGAVNRRADVLLVQRALIAAGYTPGKVDGLCGRLTIGAILALQRGFMRTPDGRIDVDGPSWRRLTAARPVAVATTTARRVAPTSSPARSPTTRPPVVPPPPAAVPAGGAKYTDYLPLPPRNTLNQGVRWASNRQLEGKFGLPRRSFSQDCQPATNPDFMKLVVTESVGPFRVTGPRPAVASLRTIFTEVGRDHPELYKALGTAGMMCCRHVRGSSTSISNHAWGTAIDMKVGGVLVSRGRRAVLLGLQLIAPYFQRHGWYWGAAFSTPDAHHFECGAALVESFQV